MNLSNRKTNSEATERIVAKSRNWKVSGGIILLAPSLAGTTMPSFHLHFDGLDVILELSSFSTSTQCTKSSVFILPVSTFSSKTSALLSQIPCMLHQSLDPLTASNSCRERR